jgi:hypothetical protein
MFHVFSYIKLRPDASQVAGSSISTTPASGR